MLNLHNRIYSSSLINAFGNWLTFLAIALVVKEKYGTSQLAIVFLVQTVPAILFSRTFASLIPPNARGKVYTATQVVLALNSFALCFDQSLALIYAHLLIGSLSKAMAAPLFNTLIGEWVPKEEQSKVFTKVGALQASTLAVAPVLGAWMKVQGSVELLFFLDGLTFLVALLLLLQPLMAAGKNKPAQARPRWRELFQTFTPRPKDMPEAVQRPLRMWFLFLGVGALLNAIEFPVFEQAALTEKEIGMALAAWGMGSLFALFLAGKKQELPLAVLYTLLLLAFVTAGSFLPVLLTFALCGLVYCLLSGVLRGSLQRSVPEGYDPLPVWAYSNQITQLINLVAYGSCGALLLQLGTPVFGGIMLALSALIVLSELYRPESRSRAAMLWASRPK